MPAEECSKVFADGDVLFDEFVVVFCDEEVGIHFFIDVFNAGGDVNVIADGGELLLSWMADHPDDSRAEVHPDTEDQVVVEVWCKGSVEFSDGGLHEQSSMEGIE